jgi:hypothetical protein
MDGGPFKLSKLPSLLARNQPRGAVYLLFGALAFWLTVEAGGARRALTIRHTPDGADAARRWQAYRRHLERLGTTGGGAIRESAPAWDQLVTYAVALGLRTRSCARPSPPRPADGRAARRHQGRLCFYVQQRSYDTDTLIGVLVQLASFYAGQPVVLIWMGCRPIGAPTHPG